MITMANNPYLLQLTAAQGLTQNAFSGQASAGVAGFYSALRAAANVNQGSSLESIFDRAAARYHVPKALLKAVAKAESNFQADAVSSCGAQGIMQLMPATARALGVTDAFDPEQNVMGGAKYLGQMLEKYDGDVKLALAAYNAGSAAVDKYDGIPPYEETQNYVKTVMGYVDGQVGDRVESGYGDQLVECCPNCGAPLYTSILDSMKSFEDYTYNDYKLFLELLLAQVHSNVAASVGGITGESMSMGGGSLFGGSQSGVSALLGGSSGNTSNMTNMMFLGLLK